METRLNASRAGIVPFQNGSGPATHYLYTPDWTQRAGSVNAQAETFAQAVSAPFLPDVREVQSELLVMRWSTAEPDVSAHYFQ